MNELLQLDEWIFRLINGDGHLAILDVIMPYWRSKYIWIPLYLFILVFVLINFPKQAWIWISFFLATVSFADISSSRIIKESVQRYRPCNDQDLKEDVKLLIRCGSGYSFTSSHATNHFAVALFLILTLGKRFRWIRIPLILWAASIAYGQVYVGVHYPGDVFAGAILGGVIGFTGAFLYFRSIPKRFLLPIFQQNQTIEKQT